MPPQTRSRGVPPPSRVYHSTTTPQQAQFPPRRRTIRTYGKQSRKPPARALRQQTLTQIDFVSSSELDKEPIVLSSDSEDLDNEENQEESTNEDEDEDGDGDGDEDEDQDEDEDEDKENRPVHDVEPVSEAYDEDEELVSSGKKRRSTSELAMVRNERTKRRRTLGDELKANIKDNSKSSRRKTTGDVPSSNYRTQTLTQFLGRDETRAELINDSEDENEILDDGGFQDWLENPESSIRKRDLRPSRSPLKVLYESRLDESRQSSVVPQTPSKPPRDEIPSSSQVSTPASTMINRYGFPNFPDVTPSKNKSPALAATPTREKEPSSSPLSTLRSTMINRYGAPNIMDPSPSQMKSSPMATLSTPRRLRLTGKPRQRTKTVTPKVEIQDTFATESWGSSNLTLTPTPLGNRVINPPSRAKTPSRESSSLADENEMDTPTKPRRRPQSAELGDLNKAKSPSPENSKKTSPRKKKKAVLEIPDSEDDDEAFDDEDEGEYVVGLETQFIMSEIASSEEHPAKAIPYPTSALEPEPAPAAAPAPAPTPAATVALDAKSSSAVSTKPQRHLTSSPPPASSQPTSPALPSSPPATRGAKESRRPLRQPLHHPAPAGTHTQPFESQRVPLATLQGLPPASIRTDILLPVPLGVLSSIIGGFQVQLSLPFRVPLQVVRFWLFDGELLRYMACADAAEPDQGMWLYHLAQVYELNNPVEGDDMREEGWVEGDIGRYTYMPPAVVGQLLWNLRHALFKEGSEEESHEHPPGRVCSPTSGSQTKIRTPTPTPNLSVSQQVEAQLQSDIAHSTQFPTSDDILVPSTPEGEDEEGEEGGEVDESTLPKSNAPAKLPEAIKPPPSHLRHAPTSYRASRPSLGRPSQATTASQASTPEKAPSFHTRPLHHSSSSIVFQDIGDSSPLRLPQSVPMGSSQLLTKSQMLPDSLLRDDGRVPLEIWDSDEDRDASL